MCSNQDEAIPQQRNQLTGELHCVKCRRDVPIVVTRVNDAFCQECFLVYAVHKFRSAIGKSKVIVPKEHVLVAYSGGPASSALLHFIQEGIKAGKIHFTVSVIHVDELGLVAMSDADRREKVAAIARIVSEKGFPFFLTSIEKAMDIAPEDGNSADSIPLCQDIAPGMDVREVCSEYSDNRLQSAIASLSSNSAREEFLRVSRSQLLVGVARQRGFSKVVVGDTATLLAVRIMTDMAKGKGGQVSFDTSIGDERYGDVMMVRPLRELNAKELEAYNKLQSVESISLPSIKDKWHRGNSIEQLTTAFVTGLQEDFPSTVPNIVRTSGKLGQGEQQKQLAKCSMCQSPLDTAVGEASALRAVEASERLSQGHHDVLSQAASHPSDDDSADRLSPGELKSSLCYGCGLTVKGMKDISLLPPCVVSPVKGQCLKVIDATVDQSLLQGEEEGICPT